MTAPVRPKVVTLGGGHGLQTMIGALTLLDVDITAVVTVADDGGSSGRLRREMPGLIPPGDLRMALAALAGDDSCGTLWAQTFQHRFTGEGALAGHPVGNLVLAGLAQVTGGMLPALQAAARMLGARGQVLPMANQPLDIVAQVLGLDDDPGAVRRIRGQAAVAATPGRVQSVALTPAEAPACPEAVAAIEAADLVVLGPGSWFTSVLPHLLLPELRHALVGCRAHRLVVLNLAPQPGETEGFSPEQHLHVLSAHAPDFRIDSVLADTDAVSLPGRLGAAAQSLGAVLTLASVAVAEQPRHDPVALAEALSAVLSRIAPREARNKAGELEPETA